MWEAPKHPFESNVHFWLLHILCISGVLGLGPLCMSCLLIFSCSNHSSTVLPVWNKKLATFSLKTPLRADEVQISLHYLGGPSWSGSDHISLSTPTSLHTAPGLWTQGCFWNAFLSFPSPLFSSWWTPMHPLRSNSYVISQGFSRGCVYLHLEAESLTPFIWVITAPLWVPLSEEASHCRGITCSSAHPAQ